MTTPPTHGDSVANALDFMMNLQTDPEPPAEPPPVSKPPEGEAIAVEQAPVKAAPVGPVGPARPPVPRRPREAAAAPKAPVAPPAPASVSTATKSKGGRPKKDPDTKKRPVAVSLDRDLAALLRFVIPAMGGLTHSQLILDAVRIYGKVAASLPDAPVVVTFQDEYYDELETEAAHRIQINGYMTPLGKDRFDADADALGLTRSDFACRVLRAYLTVDKAFVPAELVYTLLAPHLQNTVEKLKQRLDSNLPGISLSALPPPGRQQPWAKIGLDGEEYSELRELIGEAMEGGMPGCMSATEAILTVVL